MKTVNENNTLTIFPKGRIDSNNAAQTENEIMSALDSAKAENVVVDAKDLEYISSAGLRVLMKLRKAIKKPLPMVNVSRDIYEILDTTGFTELFDVKKALREMSVEGCEVIGAGSYGSVYRVADDTIVKVYNVGSPELIERERLMSQRAFVNGLPTAIPFDVVMVGDKLGVVYELLDAKTISQHITAHPEKMEEYVRKAVSELKRFHSIEIEDELFEDKKKPFYELIDNISAYLTDEEKDIVTKYLDSVPDRNTFCHGDYNFKNVMMKDGEILLIDVGDVGIGHPVFDLSGLVLAYRLFAKSGQAFDRIFGYLGIDPALADGVMDTIISEYFDTFDHDEIERYINMMMPMAMFSKAYHGIRRYPDMNDRDTVAPMVDRLVKKELIEAIKSSPKMDF